MNPPSLPSIVSHLPGPSSLVAAIVLSGFGNASASPFTAGDLAVLQAAASANNTTFSVVEVSPTSITPSTPVQTIGIDGTTMPGALRFSGSATSTGYLANSQDGSLLVFTGHNSITAGSTNANTLTARGVGTFNPAGAFSLATTYTGASGNQARGATTLNNSTWFIADQGGFYTNGTSSPNPAGNFRGVKSFGGNVYVAQASGTGTIIQVSTISAATGGTLVGLPGLANNPAIQDFHLISSGDNGASYDVLYVVSATSNTAGTISKFSLVGGTWVSNGSYTTTFGGFGLAASDSGSTAHLFVSTGLGALTANSLLDLTDTAGYNAAIAITTASNVTRYTAPTGAILKGVTFAPVAAGQPDLTISATAPASATAGVNFDYTLTVSNSGSVIATGVAVDFVLPAGLTFVSASGTNGFSGVINSGTVQFTGGTVSASAALTVTVSTNTAATYTAPAGAAVVDPGNTVVESNDANNLSAAAASTVVNVATISPQIATQPASTTITSGGTTTLTLVATGSPAPTIQWYQGTSGNISTPVGTNSSIFITPALTTNTSYWARVSNVGATVDSNTATVTIVAGATGVDLSTYVRIGRYNLPEPTRTALPPGTAAHNLLCQEASAVTYNWDTDTLFISCDGGRSITQVSKAGQLIDTMSLDLQVGAPQGTAFYDPEGITYIGGGQFVFSEERDQQLVKFAYAAGTTLTRANAQTVDLGPFDDNTGTEGLSWDPPASDFICLKEKGPIGVFRTGVDFTVGSATTAPPVVGNESSNLFNTSLLGMSDVADVFAFTNIPSMAGQPQEASLLVLGQEDARVVTISRTGTISSTLNITADPGDTNTSPGMQHEGITMDRSGNIYVVNENGGGNINYPQLWVYASSAAVNAAPTAIALNNPLNSIQENSSTASPVKVGDIAVTDDGLGTNTLSLTGADAASFEITGSALYLKAGVTLDFETKASYAVTVSVDDTTVGITPDASVNFTLTVTDQEPETAVASALAITEVAPWANNNSPVAKDWIEVTNTSTNPVTITGWKVDDNSNSFALAGTLSGVTTIASGESVIFLLEVSAVDIAAKSATFINTWFNGSAPSGFQIGYVDGSGLGLGGSNDAVNLFNASGVLQSNVSYGASDTISPFQTFDNTVAANNAAISLLSATGVNGAFLAPNSAEIGSPGYSAPGVLRITEVTPWSSGNSPVAADWFEVTNIGARAVNMSGWKFDDVSESPAGASALAGISSIAPGESVIYIQTSTLAATSDTFRSNWFGVNPPVGLQIGSHNGDGLGTTGDAVNLFDSNNVRRAKVTFGVSPSAAPFGTFDNTAAADASAVTLKSVPGVNGAFIAANAPGEVGSPGTVTSAGPQTFAQWLAGKGYSSFGFGADTDHDGIPDGIEFFFNQSPNSAADSTHMPHLVSTPGGMELDFTRLTNIGDLTGALQVSGDLSSWTTGLPGIDYTVASSVVTGDETAVTYTIPGTGPSAPGTSTVCLSPPIPPSDPAGAALGGVRIVNEGLVGVGRLSGENTDSFGETQGAASGLFITDWRLDVGLLKGTFNVLPDRGHGDGTSNYAARLHRLDFAFTPYYGAGPVAQNQVSLNYVDTTKFTYLDGATPKFTTGLNPTGTSTLFGQTVGTVTAANGLGGAQATLLSMDAEAIHLFDDGSGFISDEYGTYIARFDSDKKITGLTQLPGAAQPFRPAGTPNFDSVTAPTTGRRNNQGLEGMSVTPDGTRLFAMLQSATVQDSGSTADKRNNARLFVYDIVGSNRENPVLVGEYVVKLPQIDLNSNGSGADGTAAQSEIVALGHSSFLMLPRDGNGLGKLNSAPILFKSVQLVDFASASNILGQYDGVGQQIIGPDGLLRPEINAAATAEVINMLHQDDLTKFGLNTTIPANADTLNEKIEGMSLVPDLSTPAANDFFLFVANDNDFQSSNVMMLDAAGNVTSKGNGQIGGITNDAMFYVWRLTIDAGGKKFFRFGVE